MPETPEQTSTNYWGREAKRELKYRYYLRRFKDNRIEHIDLTLDTLQSIGGGIDNTVGIIARCQYIGHKDKNGVEIYEGDVIRVTQPTGQSRTWVVSWNLAGFRLQSRVDPANNVQSLSRTIRKGYEIKVIGNIYQNPELLKEGK